MKLYRQHIILPLLALLVFLAACHDEESVALPSSPASGLYIALTVSGETPTLPASENETATRASVIEGENSLDENMVKRMDFFLFTQEGTLKKYAYKERTSTTTTETSSTTGETNKDGETLKYYTTDDYCTLYNSNEWTAPSACLSEGDILYAVVNMDWAKATVTAPATISKLDDLKALAYTDIDIYLKKQNGADKPFLMDGYHIFTADEINAYSATAMNRVTVDVRRAAAKVKVNIFKNSNWKNWEGNPVATIGSITASLRNYASHTKAISEGTEVTDRKLSSIKHTPDNGKTAIATYTDANMANKTNTDGTTSEYASSILVYTFANNWTENTDHETSLELNIPYTTVVEGTTYTHDYNYYKIVFLPNDNGQLKRNTFYEVDIDVKNDGAKVSEEPVEIPNLQWQVAPWQTANVDVENVDMVDYLILSDYYIDLRNEATTDITFYSSNPVTVEVVGFASEDDLTTKPNANEDITIIGAFEKEGFGGYPGRAYAGEEGYMSIPGVFYVDKENRRVNIEDDIYATARAYYGSNPVKVEGYEEETDRPTPQDGDIVHIAYDNNATKEGPIHFYSRIPENVAPRYITLKVTMPTKQTGTDGQPIYLTRYAVVVQYPLEYVVGVQGLYSYMDAPVKSRNDASKTTAYDVTFASGHKNTDGNYYAWDFEPYFEADNESDPNEIIISDAIVYGPTSKTSKIWATSSSGSSGYGLDGHMARGGNMKCKFFRAEDSWSNSEGTHYGMIYQIDAMYYNDQRKEKYPGMSVQIYNNKEANNNTMYEVVVTATSTQYHIGYPEMENEGSESAEDLKVAVSSFENNNLLAPRFAFASQLGNNSAMKLWETARDQCKHYVEVGMDGTVYDNWRLPTIAELSIIKNYQLDQNVYDITMNKVVNSDGDTNPRYWTSEEDVFVHTTGAGIRANQTYKYRKEVVTYKDAVTTTDNVTTYTKETVVYEASSASKNVVPTTVTTTTTTETGKSLENGYTVNEAKTTSETWTPEIDVRCRCVRDIKIK